MGFVIDLAEVPFIDSAGVRMLFRLVGHAETGRQRVAISVDDSAPIRRLLKVTNIQEVAILCGTVEECAAALREA
jgi:anti-anti-sigma factor